MNTSDRIPEVCQPMRDDLVALLDGELSAERRRQVENHLRSCAECRSELDSESRLWELLGLAPGPPAVDLLDGVHRHLASARTQKITLRWMAAAAALLVAVGLLFTFTRQPDSQEALIAEYHDVIGELIAKQITPDALDTVEELRLLDEVLPEDFAFLDDVLFLESRR